jgi:hypothetical protein
MFVKTTSLMKHVNLTKNKININKAVKIQENSRCTTFVTIFSKIGYIFLETLILSKSINY